jgi:hypothetical protein
MTKKVPQILAGHQWLMAISLATQEAKIEKIIV